MMDRHDYGSRTITETKTVIRPFRLIGLICLLIAMGFIIACIASRWWGHSKNDVYYQGIWTSCRKFPRDAFSTSETGEVTYESSDPITKCSSLTPRTGWLVAVIVFVFGGGILDLVAIILVLVSLLWLAPSDGDKLAKLAGGLAIAAVISMAICLIIFVIFFTEVFEQIDTRMDPTQPITDQHRRWYFGWGYGCGWASTIFLSGAAVLFFCCKKEDEIYEAEKTYVVD